LPAGISRRVFEKVRDRITTRGDTFQLKNGASIAPLSSVQANMQNDLASPHACRLSAGEDEINRLLEIVLRQTTHVRGVPGIDLCHPIRKRPELGHLFRPRRLKRVRQSLRVMLKDSAAQRAKCEHYVKLAVGSGARVATGGRAPPHLDQGYYFEPTVLDLADNNNPAAQEEIFGPVVSVIGYRDPGAAATSEDGTEVRKRLQPQMSTAAPQACSGDTTSRSPTFDTGFKSITEAFSAHAGAIPSDFVPRAEIEKCSRVALATIRHAGIRHFGIRVHGTPGYPPGFRDADYPAGLLEFQGNWELVNTP
jgi:hypothetical protein